MSLFYCVVAYLVCAGCEKLTFLHSLWPGLPSPLILSPSVSVSPPPPPPPPPLSLSFHRKENNGNRLKESSIIICLQYLESKLTKFHRQLHYI